MEEKIKETGETKIMGTTEVERRREDDRGGGKRIGEEGRGEERRERKIEGERRGVKRER